MSYKNVVSKYDYFSVRLHLILLVNQKLYYHSGATCERNFYSPHFNILNLTSTNVQVAL